MKTKTLLYSISRFLDENGKTRIIATNRMDGSPTIGLSIYEYYRFFWGASPNTTSKEISQLVYLYSWATWNGIDLDSLLLHGTGMSEFHKRQFTHWLRERNARSGKSLSDLEYNSIIKKCSSFCVWLRNWQIKLDTDMYSMIKKQQFDESEKQSWCRKTVQRARPSRMSQDLTEEEIRTIQQYLHPEAAIKRGKSIDIAFRDYLIWRLTIEMGLRISEILALRLQDCPQRGRNYVSVVRINERGQDYKDPRGVYAPRPKTLSRDLGFIIDNSPLPYLIQEYISKYRYRKTMGGTKQFVLEHDFLIVTHDTGTPLSLFTAEKIAKQIAVNCGIPEFHWHICRHAFFNRAYSAVEDNQSHLNDLVYYGGWSDAKSLNIYVQRAIRNRSIKALAVWQGNRWEALDQ
jgi:integrase